VVSYLSQEVPIGKSWQSVGSDLNLRSAPQPHPGIESLPQLGAHLSKYLYVLGQLMLMQLVYLQMM
jgi:hypothetical protein